MRRSFFFGLWFLVGCLLLLWQQPDISGDEPVAPLTEISESDPPIVEAHSTETPLAETPVPVVAHSGVLVMHSLDVVEGEINHENSVYRVRTIDGEFVIPVANVLFECNSREEAYLLLKPRVLPNNPADHVSLAKWCVRNHLLEDARTEMQAAVKLSPNNMEYRYLLKQAEELLDPYRMPGDVDGTKPDRFDISDAMLQRVEPLGGMTRQQAREFTSRIQPILLNSCATARCHREGSREQISLSLKPLNRYQSLATTKHNFEQVFAQIDQEDPEASPLLTAHRGSADAISSPFDTPQGRDLEHAVLLWIVSLRIPEEEAVIPVEHGSPRTANIIDTITRDRNRRERRLQQARLRRTNQAKGITTEESKGDYLSELLPGETAATE